MVSVRRAHIVCGAKEVLKSGAADQSHHHVRHARTPEICRRASARWTRRCVIVR